MCDPAPGKAFRQGRACAILMRAWPQPGGRSLHIKGRCLHKSSRKGPLAV